MESRLLRIMLFITTVVVITSCESKNDDLFGTWKLESASSNNEKIEICTSGEAGYYVQFHENGTLSHSYSEENGSYEISDDSIVLINGGIKKNWHFEVDENVLTLIGTTSEGSPTEQIYSRQIGYKWR